MFKHSLLPSEKLTPTDTPEGRVYLTPDGPLQSVTTVIGKAFGTKALEKWRERIGEENANKISTQARNRGTAIHKIFEDYIKNRDDWRKGIMPVNYHTFLKVKPFIDEHLTDVYGIEHQLYSKSLMAAGTADLLAQFSNRFIAIADFKTAKRKFKETDDRLLKYRLQATTYAIMAEERHGIKVPYSVIIILIDDIDQPWIDITPNKYYREQVREIFDKGANRGPKLPI